MNAPKPQTNAPDASEAVRNDYFRKRLNPKTAGDFRPPKKWSRNSNFSLAQAALSYLAEVSRRARDGDANAAAVAYEVAYHSTQFVESLQTQFPNIIPNEHEWPVVVSPKDSEIKNLKARLKRLGVRPLKAQRENPHLRTATELIERITLAQRNRTLLLREQREHGLEGWLQDAIKLKALNANTAAAWERVARQLINKTMSAEALKREYKCADQEMKRKCLWSTVATLDNREITDARKFDKIRQGILLAIRSIAKSYPAPLSDPSLLGGSVT